MFKEIFLYELQYGLKKWSTYIFAFLLFVFALLIGMVSVGYFGLPQMDSLTSVNSNYAVTMHIIGSNASILGLINSVILITIIATAIQKDFQYNMHPLIFTKPISKFGYFFGRFFGAFLIAICVFLMTLLGYWLGLMLGYGHPALGEFKFWNFIQPFLVFTIPNIFLQGIIFFSLTTFLRSTLPAYLFAIIILVLQVVSGSVLADVDNKMMASLLDLTGEKAFSQVTEFWSPFEKNENIVPLQGPILYNRLLWIGLAILIMAISYFRFDFSQMLQPFRLFKRKEEKVELINTGVTHLSDLPKVNTSFSFSDSISQLIYLTKMEWKKVVKSPFYIIMVALGVAMVFILSQFMDLMYGTDTYPVTYNIIEILRGGFSLFILIFIVFYSGTMIWRDKEVRIDELIGATPVSNNNLFFSKFFAMIGSVMLILIIAAFMGIVIQFSQGYTSIDYKQYIVFILESSLSFGISLLLAMAVQVFVPNKYVAFFVALIPLLILNIVFGLLDWSHPLYKFNSSPSSLPYSDMNGYNGKFFAWFFYKGYWLCLTLALALGSLFYFSRGKEKSFKARWKMNNNITNFQKTSIAFLVIAAAGLGFIIHREERVLNHFVSGKSMEKDAVSYEKKYKHFQYRPQPRITAVFAEVNLFPSAHRAENRVLFTLENKTNTPIDTLMINYMGGIKSNFSYKKINPNRPFTQILDDRKFGVRLLKLNQPLVPGDSLEIEMVMYYAPRGIFQQNESTIVDNGTFFNSGYFLSFGYNESGELSSNRAREQYGLKSKERMRPVNDSLGRMNNYISNDADWIRFESIISTDEDQIAIAPGYLQKDWLHYGRKYYHYKMDSPILNFYAFLSGKYKVKKEMYKGISLEIYYHKGHEYNLDRMMNGLKHSLDYFTEHFGPYQHRQARIIEFPRYASFAQSFPNTIPFSESIGFITRVGQGTEDIDVPYYVTAHEIAHQWWAHQVIGGNVQGSVVMSESMSQYGALMVMEKNYGKQAMRKFLKYELNQYLKGRSMENKKELPLALVENQGYIHYNKGSLVMYALRDYLGENVLNTGIRNYLNKTKFQGPIYTNSTEFISEIRKVTPDSLQYLITDLFEKITLYESYVKKLDFKKLQNGKYEVSMTVGAAKFYADEKGKDKLNPINDFIELGIFGKKNSKGVPKELLLTKVKMDSQAKAFTFIVDELPLEAGLDPYYKLIDRNPDNNVVAFGTAPKPPNLSEERNKMIVIGNDNE